VGRPLRNRHCCFVFGWCVAKAPSFSFFLGLACSGSTDEMEGAEGTEEKKGRKGEERGELGWPLQSVIVVLFFCWCVAKAPSFSFFLGLACSGATDLMGPVATVSKELRTQAAQNGICLVGRQARLSARYLFSLALFLARLLLILLSTLVGHGSGPGCGGG
jgi:hypothetical protein